MTIRHSIVLSVAATLVLALALFQISAAQEEPPGLPLFRTDVDVAPAAEGGGYMISGKVTRILGGALVAAPRLKLPDTVGNGSTVSTIGTLEVLLSVSIASHTATYRLQVVDTGGAGLLSEHKAKVHLPAPIVPKSAPAISIPR